MVSPRFVVPIVVAATLAAPSLAADLRVALRTSGQFVAPTGSADPGFDVELLDRFAAWSRVRQGESLGLATRRVDTVPALLDAVRGGDVDIGLGGITITEERDRLVDFSSPYLPVRMVLVARAGRISPEGWRGQLAGKRLGAITGSTNARELERLAAEAAGFTPDTSFPTNESLFAALMGPSPTLDGAVVDLTHFWTMGKEAGIVMIDSLGSPQGLGFVLPEGSALKPTLDAFLAEFTGSSAYYNLVRKYFGGDAEKMVRMAKER